jgi:uncharacterized membrane protein YfcA
MEIGWDIIALLTGVAVMAGFVDSIAGGGGLLTVPAMLAAGIPPIQMLAANKLQSICGTTTAFLRYRKAGLVELNGRKGTVAAVFAGALGGAWLVQSIDNRVLMLIVPGLLVLVAAYVLFSPRMHDEDAHQRLSERGYRPLAGGIGFYDGFFGPGTGAFFATSLVALRGHGLTRATAQTKLYNVTSNAASVIMFVAGGHMLWTLGLCMGLGAMTGSWIGSHTAMRFGAGVIRPMLVVISLALTARLLWTSFA